MAPRTRPGPTLSRHLSDRDRARRMAAGATDPMAVHDTGAGGAATLGGMMDALQSFVGQLSQAATEALAKARAHQSAAPGDDEPRGEEPRGEAPRGEEPGSWSGTHRSSLYSANLGGRGASAVFGYTIRMGLDGVSAEPFGDMPQPAPRRAGADASPGDAAQDAAPGEASSRPDIAARQPIVDVFEEADGLVVVAELPGADPAGLTCRSDGRTLLIETSGARRYRKQVALPHAVEPGDPSSRFQNGILEVRLARVVSR